MVDFQVFQLQEFGSCSKKLNLDRYIGIPYLEHGRDPYIGLDCWGLILVLTKEVHGIEFPDTQYSLCTIEQKIINNDVKLADGASIIPELVSEKHDVAEWVYEIDKNEARFGDYVMFMSPRLLGIPAGMHIGMLISRQKIIHSSRVGVTSQQLRNINNKILGIYRIKL